jgi:hypothetical protein
MREIKFPELVKTKDFVGYYDDEISKVLGPNFDKWMYGQTIAEHNGRYVIYKHDVDAYLAGLRPLD